MNRTITSALRFLCPVAWPLGTLAAGPLAQRSFLTESLGIAVYESGTVYRLHTIG